jgi:hypothetical protein
MGVGQEFPGVTNPGASSIFFAPDWPGFMASHEDVAGVWAMGGRNLAYILAFLPEFCRDGVLQGLAGGRISMVLGLD